MREEFDLQNYLIEGVEGVVSEAIRATLKHPCVSSQASTTLFWFLELCSKC